MTEEGDATAKIEREPIQTITKLDAATRQLHLAIQMYFRDDDVLAVHTVTGAAHRLLRDLLIHRDGTETVNTARGGVIAKMVHKAKNFLKHADHDHADVLEFNPAWTEFFIYDAIILHMELASTLSLPTGLFLIWIAIRYPNVPLLDNTILGGPKLDSAKRLMPTLGKKSSKALILRFLDGSTGPVAQPVNLADAGPLIMELRALEARSHGLRAALGAWLDSEDATPDERDLLLEKILGNPLKLTREGDATEAK